MIEPVVNLAVACPLSIKKIAAIAMTAARFEKKIRGQVEISIIGDKRMRRLNREARGLDRPTDVLSFAWAEGQRAGDLHLLGEVYLNYAQIKRQAKRFHVPPTEEAIRMIAHGLLHLVGHNHHEAREANQMFAVQEKIVTAVGVAGN